MSTIFIYVITAATTTSTPSGTYYFRVESLVDEILHFDFASTIYGKELSMKRGVIFVGEGKVKLSQFTLNPIRYKFHCQSRCICAISPIVDSANTQNNTKIPKSSYFHYRTVKFTVIYICTHIYYMIRYIKINNKKELDCCLIIICFIIYVCIYAKL